MRPGNGGVVEGDAAIQRATSVIDWAFRRLALDYLGRADLPDPAEEEVPLRQPWWRSRRCCRSTCRRSHRRDAAGPCATPPERVMSSPPVWKDDRPMAGRIEQRLTELGITLPTPAAPIANYVPFTISGSLLVVSGQIPLRDGKVAYTGKLGAEVSTRTASLRRGCASST